MHLASKPKEAAKIHNQRAPADRIDVGTGAIFQQKAFLDVQLDDVHFEGIGTHILPKRPEIMHDALHLNGTFAHTRWTHRLRRLRSEPGDSEFLPLITVAPLKLRLRYRI